MLKKDFNKLVKDIKNMEVKSKWSKGVQEYALELLDNVKKDNLIKEFNTETSLKILLKNARDWKHFSQSGISLCSNIDIAERLCQKYEGIVILEETDWLLVQSIALEQAYKNILTKMRGM